MELLVTLSSINNLSKFVLCDVDGIIFGGPFSLRFNYSLEEMEDISEYCKEYGLKRYVTIDSFISEEDKVLLYDYIDFLKKLDPDGIYFTDLGIISVVGDNFKDKLIYDPDTLITNSLDSMFYLKQGIGVVLSRELNMDEVLKILNNNKNKVDMQVFGRLKLSYSRRKFLSNYFKHINKDYDVCGNHNLKLVEENRDYSLPIIEDKYGTRIYSDFILLIYKEFLDLKGLLKRAIIDDTLLGDDTLVFDVLRDIKRLSYENCDFIKDNLTNKYKYETFSSGYLYQKMLKKKED